MGGWEVEVGRVGVGHHRKDHRQQEDRLGGHQEVKDDFFPIFKSVDC